VYHIVGDIISSHMSERAALVIRVKLNVPFGSVTAHGTEMFFSSGSYSFMNPTQEDELFLKWAKGYSVTGSIYAKYSRYLQKQVKFTPVPDSHRDRNADQYDAKGARRSKYKIFNKINDILIQAGLK